jgi:hypothetical protein
MDENYLGADYRPHCTNQYRPLQNRETVRLTELLSVEIIGNRRERAGTWQSAM